MSVVVSQPRDALVPIIEAELRRWVGRGENLLELACLYALFPSGNLPPADPAGGGAAKAVGGDADAVLAFAAGIECMHVASLIHDDIVDQEPVRRGRASTSEHFGIAEAVVAGDGLSMAGYAAMLGAGARGSCAGGIAASRRRVATHVPGHDARDGDQRGPVLRRAGGTRRDSR